MCSEKHSAVCSLHPPIRLSILAVGFFTFLCGFSWYECGRPEKLCLKTANMLLLQCFVQYMSFSQQIVSRRHAKLTGRKTSEFKLPVSWGFWGVGSALSFSPQKLMKPAVSIVSLGQCFCIFTIIICRQAR